MSTGTTQDRRQFAQDKIADMANLPGSKQVTALRQMAAAVLGFTPGTDAIIAVDNPQLPSTANVVGTLTNEFGPDYTAVHFDLSTQGGARSYVPNPRIQAANRVVQQYGGEERYPLLIFTLPGNSGVQFVTGNPSPNNRDRLLDVVRVTAYWNSLNRTTLDCLERVGNAIVGGEPPQRAFRVGFNVQPITDEFFKDYKAAYDNAVNQLAATIERTEAEQFTQTLFNRLLFIHFVSKKGWLSFNGNHDYLNALWRDYQASPSESNFFRHRLRCLFFDGLNNPDREDLTNRLSPLIGDVPFLNGGLFEPTDLDTRAGNSEFTVPDEIIEPVLTDLFNRYNFTVMESTPLDTEVAVDPEMLGKLFEETVNERHSNGAYYTPRPVVAFMCREALKGYIAGKHISGLTEATLTDLIDNRNPQAVTPQQALEIANALAGLKAVDPACGSGAFLLGILQETLALNDSLFIASHTSESLYQQKLDIISNTIHGADKDSLAVSTAMLRLWLSLAVDYEGDDAPDPLPNLDLKLIIGDTIAGLAPHALDFTHQWIADSTLHEDIVAYTTARGQGKTDLKRRVEETKRALCENMQDAAPTGVVEWRIDFADVMMNGGFDVVIANPPYLRHEDIQPKGYKEALVRQYRHHLAPKSDLYCYFYARGLQLLRPGGMHVFVCSNTWLDTRYGAKLQDYLTANGRIHSILESAVERQFSTAAVNTIISKIEKTPSKDTDETHFVSLEGVFDDAISDANLRRTMQVPQGKLLAAPPDERKWGGRYLRAPDVYHKIMGVIGSSNLTLTDYVRGERYLNTGGADGFFVLTDVVQDQTGLMRATITSKEGKQYSCPEFLIESQFLRPGYRANGTSYLQINQPDCYILVIPPDEDITGYAVADYIAWGQQAGFHQRSVPRTLSPWWRPSLQAQQGAVLLWPRSHSENHICYHNPDQLISLRFFRFHPNQDSDTIPILAVLNSGIYALLKEIHGRRGLGLGALETGLIDILPLPFPLLTPSNKNELTLALQPLLNRRIGRFTDEIKETDRHTLDDSVLRAYGLDPGLRTEIYDAVIRLISLRRRKAANVS